MMMNYNCLGNTEKTRERRYNVLTLFIKGEKPSMIARLSDVPIKTVYNDLQFLRTHPLHNLPLNMIRDLGNSFYELKITELEQKVKSLESNPAVWLGIQKLIKEYKDTSLKLYATTFDNIAFVEGVTRQPTAIWLDAIPDDDKEDDNDIIGLSL